MANNDRARKLLVRTSLVTSTTIATLIGAQNFAMLDARDFQLTQTAVSADMVVVTPDTAATPMPITRAAPEIAIQQAAPSITILRQPGQVDSQMVVPQPVVQSASSIQPPAPSQVTAPQPVVVQQPAPQRTRSSR